MRLLNIEWKQNENLVFETRSQLLTYPSGKCFPHCLAPICIKNNFNIFREKNYIQYLPDSYRAPDINFNNEQFLLHSPEPSDDFHRTVEVGDVPAG